MNNFYLRIVLTSFFGARVQEVENEEGVMEKCVCIPIERNDLKINPKNQNVSAYFFMTECTTANIYAHIIEEADQRNADILSDIT